MIYNNLKGEKLRNVAEKKRIYLIGPCIVNSAYALAENSITAELQKLVRNQMYEVIKVFCPIHNFNLLIDISNLPIKSKDIVIFINHETNLGRENNCEVVFLKELYNRPRNEVWLKDGEPLHVNGRANRAIANYIYDNYLKKKIVDFFHTKTVFCPE